MGRISVASIASLALLSVSCTGALAGGGGNPFQQPVTVRQVPMGLNDAFHSPLPQAIVDRDCAYRQPFTIRTPQLSADGLQAFLTSIASCPSLRTLALVEAPSVDVAAQLAKEPVWGIEIGNELELSPYQLTVAEYANFIKEAYVAIREVNPNAVVITGGVYALTDDTKLRIGAAVAACPSCWIGVHLYESLSQDDLTWLTNLKVPIAVTETGYPTKCEPNGAYNQQQFLDQMIYQLSTVPNVQLITVYQRPIGPTCSALDTFGLQPGVRPLGF